jgi:hypothetical protein
LRQLKTILARTVPEVRLVVVPCPAGTHGDQFTPLATKDANEFPVGSVAQ